MASSITDINQLDFNKQYTYADYLTWQLNERVELIKGWLYKMSPAPKLKHQLVSRELFLSFGKYFNSDGCQLFYAPFDVRLIKNRGVKNQEIDTVVQPDICIICDDKKLDEAGCVGAPDLIVEILSNSTAKKDYNEKFNLYEENEVKEYWLVHPELETIQIFSIEGGKYKEHLCIEKSDAIITSKIFPDLSFLASDIFKGKST